ncbi:hypothetical protein C725_0852 [Pacificimonas flava]|uniref:Uncharacterized protein n=1 Tax=Pacificimonas flava TaxID=1234595 RepID=M2SEW4_9SPHN|nr:hypothetical protein C725_0852 [Pacificimonas flava]
MSWRCPYQMRARRQKLRPTCETISTASAAVRITRKRASNKRSPAAEARKPPAPPVRRVPAPQHPVAPAKAGAQPPAPALRLDTRGRSGPLPPQG